MKRSKALQSRVLPWWAVKSLAPWLIGGGLLVSFTASAGPRLDDPTARRGVLSFGSVALDTSAAPQTPVAPPGPGFSGMMQAPLTDVLDWLVQPSLTAAFGDRKSDASQSLLFLDQPGFLVATPLSAGAYGEQAMAATGRFSPLSLDGATGPALAGDTTSGPRRGGSSPSRLAILTAALPEGTTPAVPRAVSLSSTTPAPAEPQVAMVRIGPAAPQSVAALSPRPPVVTPVKKAPAFPGYADLIDAEDMSREQRCLAEAVYFEARSEPAEGQAAVAQVVLNRVKSGVYPDSVCGVVYQNRHRYLGCQFSFACEGKSLKITEPAPWKQAVKIARDVTFGQTYLPKVGNATHYHAEYVRPHWSRVFKKNDTVGRHIFYRPRPGQS